MIKELKCPHCGVDLRERGSVTREKKVEETFFECEGELIYNFEETLEIDEFKCSSCDKSLSDLLDEFPVTYYG